MTISNEIDQLHALRLRKGALEHEIKILDDGIRDQEQRVIAAMDAQGVKQSSSASVRASITESVLPSVSDWDAFYEYIQKHRYWHLLERRPSVSGCRELFDTKGAIPGVQTFVKRRVNVRSASDK